MTTTDDKPSQCPFEIVMKELCPEFTWDLNTHLEACLSAYQARGPHLGTAMYFAFIALCGIVHDAELRAKAASGSGEVDSEWTLPPRATVQVPWIWVVALVGGWNKYEKVGGPMGHAFGMEGGMGKPPMIESMRQWLNDRAIARWVAERSTTLRAANASAPIGDAILQAAEKFGESDDTTKKKWLHNRLLEENRLKRAMTSPK